MASIHTSSWRTTFNSLRTRNFRYLWLGMVFQMGGMNMQMLARGYLVYELTSSPIRLALVISSNALPLLGLSLFGGAIADRMDRKRIIQIGQIGLALLALVVAIGISTNNLTWIHLLLTSLIQGALIAFSMPARQAIIPKMVGRQSLSNALALNAAGMSLTTLMAPVSSGLLYATFGPDTVYYVIFVMNILASVFTSFLPRAEDVVEPKSTKMLTDIKAGLSYAFGQRLLIVLLLTGLTAAVLAMPFRFMVPMVVVELYHRASGSTGLIATMMGMGSLVGSLYIAGIGQWRRGLQLIVAIYVAGISLLLIAIVPYFYVALGVMFLMGIGDAVRRSLNQALIMENCEDSYQGRMMSLYMMNFGFTSLGVLPVGICAELLGVKQSIGLLAVLLILVGTLFLVTQPRLRKLR